MNLIDVNQQEIANVTDWCYTNYEHFRKFSIPFACGNIDMHLLGSGELIYNSDARITLKKNDKVEDLYKLVMHINNELQTASLMFIYDFEDIDVVDVIPSIKDEVESQAMSNILMSTVSICYHLTYKPEYYDKESSVVFYGGKHNHYDIYKLNRNVEVKDEKEYIIKANKEYLMREGSKI